MAKKKAGQFKTPFLLVLFALLIYGGFNIYNKGLPFELPGYDSSTVSDTSDSRSEASDTMPSADKLSVRVLDIGQGDCILITTPGGKQILVDAGDLKNTSAVTDKLDYYGVDDIEYMLLTHPHSDHIGAADLVIKSHRVRNIYMTDCVSTSAVYSRMISAIEADEGINVLRAVSGEMFTTDGVKIELLSPIRDSYSDTNQYSIVALLSYGDFSMLLTGDAETLNEEEIMRKYPSLRCDVIKTAHHGSDTSSSYGFLSLIKADNAIISVGEGNSYGHPHTKTLRSLSELGYTVYRTDTSGTISVITDGKTYSIEATKP